jgi:hypothetical protein
LFPPYPLYKKIVKRDTPYTKVVAWTLRTRDSFGENMPVDIIEVIHKFRGKRIHLLQNSNSLERVERWVAEEMSRERITGEVCTVHDEDPVSLLPKEGRND